MSTCDGIRHLLEPCHEKWWWYFVVLKSIYFSLETQADGHVLVHL
jgi:hypothetical protein